MIATRGLCIPRLLQEKKSSVRYWADSSGSLNTICDYKRASDHEYQQASPNMIITYYTCIAGKSGDHAEDDLVPGARAKAGSGGLITKRNPNRKIRLPLLLFRLLRSL